jgi:ubiquitin C-terminal hydrolase
LDLLANMRNIAATAAAEVETVPRIPTDSSGFYELIGVVTHVGRLAESGHYIGWARQSGDNWLKFDDSVVTPITTEDIKQIATAGGMSYATE